MKDRDNKDDKTTGSNDYRCAYCFKMSFGITMAEKFIFVASRDTNDFYIFCSKTCKDKYSGRCK